MGMSVIGCHITDMTRGMSGIVGIISRLVADDWTDWDRRIVLDPLHSTPCNNRRTDGGGGEANCGENDGYSRERDEDGERASAAAKETY